MSHVFQGILRLPPAAALFVVFALPALEASAFIGVVVPGEITIVLGGVLANQGVVPLWAVLGCAIAGAVTGQTIRRRGGRAVLVGRFTAALRALVPGMAGMPYRTLLPWTVIGGVLWASAYVLLRFAAGSRYARIDHDANLVAGGLLVAVVVGFAGRQLRRRRAAGCEVPVACAAATGCAVVQAVRGDTLRGCWLAV